MNPSHDPSRFLRRALLGNAAFSAVSGATMVATAAPLARWIGIPTPALLIGVGVTLIGFAAALTLNARARTVRLPEAWLAVAMDLAWVGGSVAVISAGLLAPAGNWLVGIVANVVLIFALLQIYGLRKMRRIASA